MSKYRLFLNLTILSLTLVVYQNCAQETSFSGLSESSSKGEVGSVDGQTMGGEDHDDLGDGFTDYGEITVNRPVNDGGRALPKFIDPEEEVTMQRSLITLEPQINKVGGLLNIIVFLDDSYSNVENNQTMLLGLRNLLTNLVEKRFNLQVYTTDTYKVRGDVFNSKKEPYSLAGYPDANKTIREESLLDPLAQVNDEDSIEKKEQFFSRISGHLEMLKRRKSLKNTRPNYFCDLMAYFDGKIRNGGVETDRYAVVVVSDENMANTCSCDARMTETVPFEVVKHQHVIPALKEKYSSHYRFSETRGILEDGSYGQWKARKIYYPGSCAEAKESKRLVIERFKNTDRKRLIAWDCEEKLREGRPEQIIPYNPPRKFLQNKMSETQWLLDVKDNSCSGGEERQNSNGYSSRSGGYISSLHKLVSPNRLFFSSFIITGKDSYDAKSQSVGKNHVNLSKMITNNQNSYVFSISERNYSGFLDHIVDFEYYSSNNEFTLPAHLSGNEIVKINLMQSNGAVRQVAFIQSGDLVTVQDIDINLGEGADLELVY